MSKLELREFSGRISTIEDKALRGRILELIGAVTVGLEGEYNNLISDAWKAGMGDELFKELRAALNPQLALQQREFTIHGIHRSFRFWSEPEKKQYLSSAMEIVETIRPLTPNICLGYGSALAVARSSDLIPHDDDIDVLAAFDKEDYPTFNAAAQRVIEVLGDLGEWEVFQPDCGVPNLVQAWRSSTKIDIFICLAEGSTIASFPGPRHTILVEDLFPSTQEMLFGVAVPMPQRADEYLAKVYGPTWSVPNPFFSHSWDYSPYADLLK